MRVSTTRSNKVTASRKKNMMRQTFKKNETGKSGTAEDGDCRYSWFSLLTLSKPQLPSSSCAYINLKVTHDAQGPMSLQILPILWQCSLKFDLFVDVIQIPN